MFDQLRRNTKTIIWVTAIAFVGLIFLAWGADFQLGGTQAVDPNTLGMVNGQPISTRAYEIAVAQARASYQQQTGRQVDDRTDVFVRQQTWDEMIQESILQQEARQRGITVTDEEVVQAVLNQPPPELIGHPSFTTDGQFDLAKYQAYLRTPGVDTRSLELQYRSTLPVQKLQMEVVGTVSVSDAELWDAFRMQNEKVEVSYLSLPVGQFQVEESGISDPMVEDYYRSHQETYRRPPQAVIRYVQLPRQPTTADSLDLITQGEQILQEVSEGEDFSILVDAYSEAPANMRGGETAAWLTADQISDPNVRTQAFDLGVGEVSGVLSGRDGIHIIKVEGRQEGPQGDQVKLADIYVPLRPSIDTLSELRERIHQFRQEVEERAFDEVAAEMDLAVRQTAAFTEAGFIAGLGAAPQIQEFAFKNPVGAISPPLERADGWLVAQVQDRQESRIPDLNEVLERVRNEVADSLRLDLAVTAAGTLLGRVQAGTPLQDAAREDGRATFGRTEPFSRLGFPQGIGGDPAVIGPVFARDVGLIPEVLRGRTGAYVVVVEEKTAANRDAFETQKEQLRRSTLQRRQQQVFNDWLADLRKSAEVEDYRFGRYDL